MKQEQKTAEKTPAILTKLLLFSSFLLVLPHIGQLNTLFIVFSLTLLLWRALAMRYPQCLPKKILLLPTAVLLVLFVLKEFNMSLGRDASSSLLIILIGLKMLEGQTKRDAQAVIYIAFFILITPFLFDQKITQALYSLALFFILLIALIINNSNISKITPPAFIRITGLILLQGIPLMLVFFIFFPRMIGPLWALPDDVSTAVSGISDHINPGAVSNLALSEQTAFRVQFKGQQPTQQELYWRGPVFWKTDGQQWTLSKPPKLPVEINKKIADNRQTYQYTMMMEPHQQFWLYSLDTPIKAPPHVELTGDFQLIAQRKLSRNISFDMSSSTHKKLTSLTSDDKHRALELPDNTDPRIKFLVKQWLEQSKSEMDVINQALQFYNQQFYYTLTPPSLGNDPVAEFLFNTKRGFCGHFASSFAILMRVAHIPARLVAGYQGGMYNKVGDFYTIRQADAHVWTEVWLDNSGWVRIDPTAAIAPDRIQHSIDVNQHQLNGEVKYLLTAPEGLNKWSKNIGSFVHSLDYYWQNAVLAYGPETQLDFLSNVGITDWTQMVIWLSIISGFFVLLSLTSLFISRREKNDPIQKLYLSFCKRLAKQGGSRYPYETASAYFQRVAKKYPSKKQALKKIEHYYLNARYGHGSIESLKQALKRFKHH